MLTNASAAIPAERLGALAAGCCRKTGERKLGIQVPPFCARQKLPIQWALDRLSPLRNQESCKRWAKATQAPLRNARQPPNLEISRAPSTAYDSQRND